MLFVATVLIASVGIASSCHELQCNETSSSPNFRLMGHGFKQGRVETISACIRECDKETKCRSINFKLMGLLCELNKADVHIAAHKYIPAKGFVYANNPWPKVKMVSTLGYSLLYSLIREPKQNSSKFLLHK